LFHSYACYMSRPSHSEYKIVKNLIKHLSAALRSKQMHEIVDKSPLNNGQMRSKCMTGTLTVAALQKAIRCYLPLEIFRSVGRLVALWNDTVFDFLLPDEGCSCFAFGDVL
jgi:hypothetical protein